MELVDFLYPKKCLECKTSGKYLCRSCMEMVPKSKLNCPMCKKASIDGITHVKCLTPWGLNGLFSLYEYKGAIRKAITSLKYKYAVGVGVELVDHSFEILKRNDFLFNKNQTLVPIPLYWYKENFRGFNQSTELGRVFAQKFGFGFTSDLVIKKKSSKNQAGLKREDRKSNVEGVFVFNSNYKQAPTDCILFDDVYTTGFTMAEACKTLKRNGIQKVWGLTVAR